jgi:hypothetical protein
MLEELEYLFTLQGGFLNKKKYVPVKKIIFDYFRSLGQRNQVIKRWLEKGLKTGNDETKAILQGRE